jgi:hypothetical protein
VAEEGWLGVCRSQTRAGMGLPSGQGLELGGPCYLMPGTLPVPLCPGVS